MTPTVQSMESRLLLSAQLVEDLRPGSSGSGAMPFVAVGDTVFFRANDGAQSGLWKTRGTPATTSFVAPLPVPPSTALTDWAAANGHAFWVAPSPGLGPPYNLYTSDGTPESVRVVHAIYMPAPGTFAPPGDPDHIVASGGYVYFRYRSSPTTIQLWKTDGTDAGTTVVKSFTNSSANAAFTGVDVNGTFFFEMSDAATGNEIWKTDGTEAGTQVIDLSPGNHETFVHSLANVNGTLYFAGSINDINDRRGGVFRSDGTVAGTEVVAPVFLDLSTFEMEPVGDTLFFSGNDAANNNFELWKTDGTAAGTGRVKDVNPGPASSLPVGLTAVGNQLFFFANGGTDKWGLWRTDGTEAGTAFLKPVTPPMTPGQYPWPPGYSAASRGLFVFAGNDGNLWRSDGTPEGTVPVNPGVIRSPLNFVRTTGGDVYFGAAGSRYGTELWRFTADATVAGRHVFYNNSVYDGADPLANEKDDAAIAPDKQAAMPGPGGGPFSNVTSYAKGLNGVMVDIAGLPASSTLTTDDFEFRTGTTGAPGNWGLAPHPIEVTIRRGAGVNGSDRVTLTWRDYNPMDASPIPGAVANAWLQVRVLPNERTGLTNPDTFMFGNLIGETGDAGPVGAAVMVVNAIDLSRTRANQLAPAPITSPYDFNRDGRINAIDLGICRANQLKSLPLAVPTSPAAPASTLFVRREGELLQ